MGDGKRDKALQKLLQQQASLMELVKNGGNLEAPCRRAVQAEDNILVRIMTFLPVSAQHYITLVNKRWCKIARSDEVWKEYFRQTYGLIEKVTQPGFKLNWRMYFKNTAADAPTWINTKEKSEVLGEKVQAGHQGKVTCACVYGTRAATGGDDFLVMTWDLTSGQLVKKFRGHTMTVTAVVMDGSRLLSASADGGIRIWHLKNGHCLTTVFVHAKEIVSVGMAGKHFMSASLDATILLFDRDKEAQQTHILKGHRQDVRCTHFALDQRDNQPVLLSGSSDTTVRLWSLMAQSARHIFRGHTGMVTNIDRVGDIAFSASVDKTVRLWNIVTGESVHTLTFEHVPESIWCDGTKAIMGFRNGGIQVLNRASYKCMNTIGKSRHPVKGLYLCNKVLLAWIPNEKNNPSLRMYTISAKKRDFSSAAMSVMLINRFKKGFVKQGSEQRLALTKGTASSRSTVSIKKAKSFNGPPDQALKTSSTSTSLHPDSHGGRGPSPRKQQIKKSVSALDISQTKTSPSPTPSRSPVPPSRTATPPSGPGRRPHKVKPSPPPATNSEAKPREMKRDPSQSRVNSMKREPSSTRVNNKSGETSREKSPVRGMQAPRHSASTLHLLQEARAFLNNPLANAKVSNLAAKAKDSAASKKQADRTQSNPGIKNRDLSGLLIPMDEPRLAAPRPQMKQSRSMVTISSSRGGDRDEVTPVYHHNPIAVETSPQRKGLRTVKSQNRNDFDSSPLEGGSIYDKYLARASTFSVSDESSTSSLEPRPVSPDRRRNLSPNRRIQTMPGRPPKSPQKSPYAPHKQGNIHGMGGGGGGQPLPAIRGADRSPSLSRFSEPSPQLQRAQGASGLKSNHSTNTLGKEPHRKQPTRKTALQRNQSVESLLKQASRMVGQTG
eukprot:TRINITY_DN407_c0_g1_i2.p1 TRINITY_DN407_c0_g1~~TRINITY_DN407_c0_g1_i2.p1  ORF type:complete len:891 (+),score=102.07 TRINITY_DN407_c0_g1_i2:316-2988(+)